MDSFVGFGSSLAADARAVRQRIVMGKLKGPYNAEFPAGSRVRIADRAVLETFREEWRLHNPLQPEQLEFGGQLATVADVGYYHGGDELYRLKDVPGIWHEKCLRGVDGGAAA